MKLEMKIEGIPRISPPVYYTKGRKGYIPGAVEENERLLKGAIVNRLPYNFLCLKGRVRINKLHFVFPPPVSFSSQEKEKIDSGGIIEKSLKPGLKDCLNSFIRALCGTVISSEPQITGVDELRKYYSKSPCIIFEAEEV